MPGIICGEKWFGGSADRRREEYRAGFLCGGGMDAWGSWCLLGVDRRCVVWRGTSSEGHVEATFRKGSEDSCLYVIFRRRGIIPHSPVDSSEYLR